MHYLNILHTYTAQQPYMYDYVIVFACIRQSYIPIVHFINHLVASRAIVQESLQPASFTPSTAKGDGFRIFVIFMLCYHFDSGYCVK